jgi:hypothetical protein
MLQYLLVAPPVDFPSAFFDTSIVTNAGQPLEPYNALAQWSRAERRRGRVAGPR